MLAEVCSLSRNVKNCTHAQKEKVKWGKIYQYLFSQKQILARIDKNKQE